MATDLKIKTERLAFRGLMYTKGYNSKQLAEEVGMSESVLSNRIRGYSPWLWAEVVKVCRVLGIAYDEFVRHYPA